MSVIGSEGWDMYNAASAETGFLARWVRYQSQSGNGMIAGRFGGQAARLTDGAGGSAITRYGLDLGASYGTFCIGMAFRPSSANAICNPLLFQTAEGSLNQLYVTHDSADKFSVQRGDGVTIIPPSSFTTTVGQWCYVEVAFTIADSGGYVELWVNGISQGSFTGDTQQQASADFRYLELRSPNDVGAGNAIDIDDMYWKNDATPLGEIKVTTIRAVADTADADFIPVGASPGYDCVNETLVDGDTTYVQGSTSGDLDLYEFEDLVGDPSAIFAVNAVMFAKKTDVGARTLNLTVKSGATQDDGAAVTLNTVYGRYERMLPLDPDGSIPWTKTSVNALLGGPKIP